MAGKPSYRARASQPALAETRDFPRAGTRHAIYSSSICSGVALSVPTAKGSWGGARNRADRVSDALADHKVDELLEAARFALATGRTFQRHWIVHYGRAGIGEHEAAGFIRKLFERVGKQAKRAGGELTALWVRERASGYGEHIHILLHLPAGLSLRNRTRRWIAAAGGTYRPGVSMTKSIGGRLVKQTGKNGSYSATAHYQANAANVVRYLLKSAELAKGQRLGLKHSGRGGRIIGKRCGWTQNIGRAARSRVLKSAAL